MFDVFKLVVVSLGFVAITLVGTGCDDDEDSPDCSLKSVLDRAETAGTADCGSLALGDSDAAFEAMRDCISGAVLDESPFRAAWDVEGIDSELGQAYLGRLDGGVFEIVSYHYDSDVSGVGNAEPRSFGTQCRTFTAAEDPCGSLREDLCFVCEPGEVVERCP